MKTVYQRGAENGLIIGLFLTVVSSLLLAAADMNVPSILVLALFLLFPVISFMMLRKTFREERGETMLSALWLQGIVGYVGGSLIFALAGYVYLRWINPMFIPDQVSEAIKVYSEVDDPNAREVVTVLRQIEKTNAYPSPQQIVTELGLFITFIGSVTSLFIATFLTFSGKRKRKNTL